MNNGTQRFPIRVRAWRGIDSTISAISSPSNTILFDALTPETLGQLIGRDNRGDDGVSIENEPGNQTAAIDFRWSLLQMGLPLAFYGQFMAEDEAGGFPSRYLGQLGLEGSGHIFEQWSYRWYAEASATSCDFWKSEEIFNCAYNHAIYKTGYRYRGRVLGHSADNDARVITLGFVLVDTGENSCQGYIRSGRLNRGGPPDQANSLTP